MLSKGLGVKPGYERVLRKCSCHIVKLKLFEAEDVENSCSSAPVRKNVHLRPYSLNCLSFPVNAELCEELLEPR